MWFVDETQLFQCACLFRLFCTMLIGCYCSNRSVFDVDIEVVHPFMYGFTYNFFLIKIYQYTHGEIVNAKWKFEKITEHVHIKKFKKMQTKSFRVIDLLIHFSCVVFFNLVPFDIWLHFRLIVCYLRIIVHVFYYIITHFCCIFLNGF